MAKYILALCMMASTLFAGEHWIIQLPITNLTTNSTATIDTAYPNRGIIRGWYIDVSGSESASFTSTVSAVHSTKGVRTLASGVVATVQNAAITNALSLNMFDEQIRIAIISPANATNTVSVNAVILYEN